MNDPRRDELEEWWALTARVMAAVLGATILLAQTFLATADRPYLIAAGVALISPALAQALPFIGAQKDK